MRLGTMFIATERRFYHCCILGQEIDGLGINRVNIKINKLQFFIYFKNCGKFDRCLSDATILLMYADVNLFNRVAHLT